MTANKQKIISIKRNAYEFELTTKFPEDDWRNQLAIRMVDVVMYSLREQFETYTDNYNPGVHPAFEYRIHDDEAWKMNWEIVKAYINGDYDEDEITELDKICEAIKRNFSTLTLDDFNESKENYEHIVHQSNNFERHFDVARMTIKSNTESFHWKEPVFPDILTDLYGEILKCISRYKKDAPFLKPLNPEIENVSIEDIFLKFQTSKELKKVMRIVKKALIHLTYE